VFVADNENSWVLLSVLVMQCSPLRAIDEDEGELNSLIRIFSFPVNGIDRPAKGNQECFLSILVKFCWFESIHFAICFAIMLHVCDGFHRAMNCNTKIRIH
jgi:hypothetical protein